MKSALSKLAPERKSIGAAIEGSEVPGKYSDEKNSSVLAADTIPRAARSLAVIVRPRFAFPARGLPGIVVRLSVRISPFCPGIGPADGVTLTRYCPGSR